MEELKVKEEYELNKLEDKYGFKFNDNIGKYVYRGEWGNDDNEILINSWNRKVEVKKDRNDDIILKLYDLIKGDIVVKEKRRQKMGQYLNKKVVIDDDTGELVKEMEWYRI